MPPDIIFYLCLLGLGKGMNSNLRQGQPVYMMTVKMILMTSSGGLWFNFGVESLWVDWYSTHKVL
jgi:hypothetical protein